MYENIDVMDTDEDNDKLGIIILFDDKSLILNYDFNEIVNINGTNIMIYEYLYGLTNEAQRVEQYLGCDLMILDDLGTEMITAYSTSALYTLINTRLTRAKATIISTNCSNEELQKKYTPQILSRIEGEYQTLPFVGRDIRQIKKEREA